MHLILFDCDGTLSDTCGTICETMRRAFVTAGLKPPSDAATMSIIGLSLVEAMEQLLPHGTAELYADLAKTYRETMWAMRDNGEVSDRLFPGIADLVADLAAREDVLLGIVTGKSRRGVEAILSSHGLRAHFLPIRTADDCPSKPHPAMVQECCAEVGVAPSSTVVVGDALFDMRMAVSAGARAVGVAWGVTPPAMLREAGADAVAGDTAELGFLLSQWIDGGHLDVCAREDVAPA
ncbi:HAD-IA family hydrolase [Consotaella salsifontis]|uniref:Phosphoglycolate phosphatase n=1 Tax=Consotaella salsifontis TaxID=1365950 RepID=A0A1T4SZ19_9HYPH|nr:HAD-IA family hydrolase [Consotaella salsifontis]SKA33427.1 phosphoglycolate phosphatase [Consotaella salsifontis]